MSSTHPISSVAPDPQRICRNCLATWRARKPRPDAVYCHHTYAVAMQTLTGWYVRHASDSMLRALRSGGLL